MADINERYLKGIQDLLPVIPPTAPDYLTVLTLQGRLAGAIAEIRQYGPTDTVRVEMSRVTSELDRLCLANLGKSFRHLCGIDQLAQIERPKIYHNLPQPDYGRFIGREAELAKIYELLSPANRHFLVTIDGIGGIGKSALALEAAHHYLREADRLPEAERFEAIIWASAKSSVLTADGIKPRQQITRTLEDIYTTISMALEREDIVRARSEEQDRLVTRALTRQRTLLIVDNLETIDDERVNAFLRELPAPTKAMVTTRHRLDVAYPVRLTGMPEKDGLALIAQEREKKSVTLTGEQARRLYDRTGGVPLALVWSIAQMGAGHNAETILARLGQPSEDISQFCFKAAIDLIYGTTAYKLLLALSLFSVDASRESLSYVVGLGKDIVSRDKELATLERLSLINKRGERFGLLPLTKGYVLNELALFCDRHDFETRWIDYFVELCREYGSEYWNWLNYEWLLAEGENILGLAKWSVEVDRSEITLRLYYGILRYLDIKGRWEELVFYGEFLLDVARSRNERRIMAWICTHWLSWVYGERGMDRGEVLAREGINFYKEIGDTKGECLSMGYLSRSLRIRRQMETSREIALEMLRLAQRINYQDGIASAYDQMGKIARDLKLWTEAKEYFEKARSWCESENADLDISQLMNIFGNLGWVESNLGHHERGRELCQRSWDFFSRIGGRGYSTTLWYQMAVIEFALGHKEQAIEHAKNALYWAEQLNITRYINSVHELFDQINVASTE